MMIYGTITQWCIPNWEPNQKRDPQMGCCNISSSSPINTDRLKPIPTWICSLFPKWDIHHLKYRNTTFDFLNESWLAYKIILHGDETFWKIMCTKCVFSTFFLTFLYLFSFKCFFSFMLAGFFCFFACFFLVFFLLFVLNIIIYRNIQRL